MAALVRVRGEEMRRRREQVDRNNTPPVLPIFFYILTESLKLKNIPN